LGRTCFCQISARRAARMRRASEETPGDTSICARSACETTHPRTAIWIRLISSSIGAPP